MQEAVCLNSDVMAVSGVVKKGATDVTNATVLYGGWVKFGSAASNVTLRNSSSGGPVLFQTGVLAQSAKGLTSSFNIPVKGILFSNGIYGGITGASCVYEVFYRIANT